MNHSLAWSMVDESPWLASKLNGAQPTVALVIGKGMHWHGEMEGRLVKHTMGGDGWYNCEIWPAMNSTEVASS
jgi:hypothetical protein